MASDVYVFKLQADIDVLQPFEGDETIPERAESVLLDDIDVIDLSDEGLEYGSYCISIGILGNARQVDFPVIRMDISSIPHSPHGVQRHFHAVRAIVGVKVIKIEDWHVITTFIIHRLEHGTVLIKFFISTIHILQPLGIFRLLLPPDRFGMGFLTYFRFKRHCKLLLLLRGYRRLESLRVKINFQRIRHLLNSRFVVHILICVIHVN